MFFKLQHQDKKTHARAGVIRTAHGDIETPVFMPVGTQATVKTLDSQDLENLGAEIILGNTYHLHLRPGEDVIAKAGGIHKFMNWNKPVLTDSGGFQVFSLGKQKAQRQDVILNEAKRNEESRSFANTQDDNNKKLVKITDDGVEFRSHLDGSKHFFSPEESIKIQHKLGADIIMAFDECTADEVGLSHAKKAMDRTHKWAEKSLVYHQQVKSQQSKVNSNLFGIIQGAQHKDLREESAKFISSLDFDGIAVGGESVGYNMDATKKILDWVYPLIPVDKPHYAMGLGLNPADLFEVVERGIDMFDCVAPTRLARHGMLYIKDKKQKYRLNITNAKFRKDFGPIDKNCTCPICLPVRSGAKAGKNYSRAYIHHLFDAGEMTGMRLATIHNIHFFLNLMREMRVAILEDEFLGLKKQWV